MSYYSKFTGSEVDRRLDLIVELENDLELQLVTAKEYTDDRISEIINGAPETLDTLKEVSDAIKANEDVVTALNESIGSKADKSSLVGLATESFVTTEISKIPQYDDTEIREMLSKKLESIPSEYVTEEELLAKGYLTEHQDISGLTTKEEFSTAQSNVQQSLVELENDLELQLTTLEHEIDSMNTGNNTQFAQISENLNTVSAFMNFYEGSKSISSVAAIPIDKRLVIATIATSESFALSEVPTSGREIHIIINNSSTSAITIALPNTGNYVCMTDTALSLDAGAYAEVNVISDGSKMYIRSI